ncbi:hypothetical protein ADIS_3126 [Lunatimonas lonarensis]|uniref:Secretion system C-terminal sorting domain-containing protein n=1 Tax=Lunatimonas lonarensis TaxID=1232681 RepID=R7ZRA4_9BACT|nr:T9SS type A sorting domain-containing protein [Lunatimonas lonarensis]EON76676.1 hypothetical protein ADIS_3126 [Lunatimonas lonarensis]
MGFSRQVSLTFVGFCVFFQVFSFQEQELFPLHGTVTASSVHQSALPDRAIDGNLNTNWTSDNPLPDRYLSQTHHNVLLGIPLFSASGIPLAAATDGSLQTATPSIPVRDGVASVSHWFPEAVPVEILGLRLGGLQQAVTVRLFQADGDIHELHYPLAANFQHLRFSPDIPPITGFELSSPAGFYIFELGMTRQPFVEFLTLKLDSANWVKEIHTKHWAGAGNAEKTSLYVGLHPDSLDWVADLNPESLELTRTVLMDSYRAKYIRIAHTVRAQNFRKVSVFEVAAFGELRADPVPGPQVVWDPDAGIYAPLSEGSQVTASSSVSNPVHQPQAALDNNFATSWISDNPLPDRYLSNPDQNILLGRQGEASGGVQVVNATDGVLGNFTPLIQVGTDGTATYRLVLEPAFVRRLNLRVGSGLTVPVTIRLSNAAGNVTELIHPAGTNANLRHVVDMDAVTEIFLSAEAPFSIQEIGAYSKPLSEHITLDLGEIKSVSWIRTRHWNGSNNSLGARLFAGKTLEDLQLIEVLDPSRLDPQLISMGEPFEARYVRLVHDLVDENFKKATVQEITVYDQHGTYGPAPSPKPQQRSFSELFGLNTVWAWGTNKIPSLQGPNEGAQKFSRVASQARNYHNIHWDTTDPDFTPTYDPDNLNVHMQWTQWHREYQDWKNKGFTVDATFTFDRFPETAWGNPFESAYALGQAFGSVYGPAKLNLVRTVEVGNEPWDYSDSTYVKILEGMAKGLKEADPDLIVLPAALQASGTESGNSGVGKNYMGLKLSETAAQYLDGVNVHLYSYTRNASGTRIAVHPEHPESTMQALFAAMRFRDKNMPDKEVHVTEWGWDASSANETAVNSEAVSAMDQAVYALRGLFWLSRMGVDRAHWYFYANVDIPAGGTPLNYDRSGLTESKLSQFREKRSFVAVAAMQERMGDLYFDEVLREDEQGYVYALRNDMGEQTHLLAWRPVTGSDSSAVFLTLPMDRPVREAWYLSGLSYDGEEVSIQNGEGGLQLPLSSKPLLVRLGSPNEFSNPQGVNLRVESQVNVKQLVVETSDVLGLDVYPSLIQANGEQVISVNWVRTGPRSWSTQVSDLPPGRHRFRATFDVEAASNEVELAVYPSLQLFPNPASDRLKITFSHALETGGQVEIYGYEGRIRRSIPVLPGSLGVELDLTGLTPGLYVVKCAMVAGFPAQQKLVIR